jgi:hypothetical protein
MATGRRPITSDKRPSATAAAAVTATIAAEIDPKVRIRPKRSAPTGLMISAVL